MAVDLGDVTIQKVVKNQIILTDVNMVNLSEPDQKMMVINYLYINAGQTKYGKIEIKGDEWDTFYKAWKDGQAIMDKIFAEEQIANPIDAATAEAQFINKG